ncbi:MAG: efflux RND transporter permease subunit [Bacteroidota bacterium]|nr:efflux RND transporter permease subunit [Bacteroidota bacterium]MDP4190441.1 efflux RND transporter permease subunit [Bacteroidota bacterium]MDP4194185.1 efflux RND transporter permease subunit [Bacteroidota bacterium]
MWLTRLALKYPISTFLFAVTIMIFGYVSFSQLPVDLLPNITIPVITTVTFYSGAGPLDMEQSVTTLIERNVSSVSDVDYVQSSTKEGISQVRINFNWDANVDVGLVDVVQRVNRIINQLPTGVQQPTVLRFDITNLPVCNIAVSGDMDERDLYDLAYNNIEPQIEHLPGVASAQVLGGKIREIHITIDRDRLQALQIPVTQVLTAIASSNLILPSGDLKTGNFDYSLKTESRFNVIRPMEDIVVRVVNGVPVRIKDIAKVEDSYQEQTEIIRINGKPGLTLRVQKLASANTVDVVNAVLKALPKLNGIPENVKLTLSFDQSLYIKQTISGLQREAVLGAVLAMLVIMLFLRNLRGTLIILVAIPLSILITFIWFRFGNVTLNIMTFGGLALAVGRLVDDSIVELEAISRHYNERKEGQSKIQATLDAAKEVASPIFVSTLTTVIVFLPIVFLTGIAKMLFIPLTITIAVALFGSFFISRTVTPLMCLKYLPPEKLLDRQSTRLSDRIRVIAHDTLDKIDDIYVRLLSSVLKRKKVLILSIIGVAALSLILFKFIGTEFFPDQDEGQFTMSIKLPVGTRAEVTDKTVREIESIILKNVPEVQAMISDIGVPATRSGNFFSRNAGSHAANVQVALVPVEERNRSVFEIVKQLRPKLTKIPGAAIFINTGGFLKFLMNFGSSAPIDVEIRGFDLDAGSQLAKDIVAIVRATPGATDVQISREDNLPELRVRIDRDKAGVLGINVAEISNTINTMINGSVASLYTDPVTGNQYNILVRLNEDYRSQIGDLQKINITTPSGEQVLLGNIATIERANAPVQIDRKYQQRLVEVTANVTGRDLGSVANDIRDRLQNVTIPPGFEVKLTGNVEQQQKTFRDLLLAFGLAILLVYVVMASQFQSFLDPFIIMFTVPLGIVGVLWALFLTDTTLSVTSFQGIIVMVGIVVSNGILLVDYTNHLRMKGVTLTESILQAGRTRLKPILMTSLATVLGLIPMAAGIGGEATQAPLAIAVIGGLTVSTILTLFYVPALYMVFEQRIKRDVKPEEANSE